jgi:hypothetical protein
MAWGYTNRYLTDDAVLEMLANLRAVVGTLLEGRPSELRRRRIVPRKRPPTAAAAFRRTR